VSRSVIWLWVVAAAIVAAPLALLADVNGVFGRDWNNNLWMISYGAGHLISQGQFPDVYNVAQHVGVPQPIFYGPVLYPCLSLLSEPLGADLAIRAACLGLWSLQFWLVFRLSRAVRATIPEAVTAGALVSWSIYPLTNLYNRGALAEFFGTGFLLCAVASGGLALIDPIKRRRVVFALLFALCCAMSFGSHAPTALIGGPLLLVAAICALRLDRGRMKGRAVGMAGVAVVVALILLPWIYVVHENAGRLVVQTPNDPLYPMAGHWSRSSVTDSWLARLKPLPMDDPWTSDAKSDTPHLDAEWNFPLVMLAVWSCAGVWRRRAGSGLSVFSAIAGAGLLAVSITPSLQNLLPAAVGAAIQFPYRLVSHVNIAAFMLLAAAWLARGPGRSTPRSVLAGVLIISAVGLGIKLYRAAPSDRLEQNDLTRLPSTFVGEEDYAVEVPNRMVPEAARSGAILLDAPAGLGPGREVQSVSADFATPAWVVTSVMNFPWDRLTVDGRAVPFDEVYNLGFHQAVKVSAGTHTFGFRFEPDAVWVRLNAISRAVLALLVILFAAATFLLVLRG
jgi:hypothetical protein